MKQDDAWAAWKLYCIEGLATAVRTQRRGHLGMYIGKVVWHLVYVI